MKNMQAFIIRLFTILLSGAATANAATWTITKAANGNDNLCDADCSLHKAVFNADSSGGLDLRNAILAQSNGIGVNEGGVVEVAFF